MLKNRKKVGLAATAACMLLGLSASEAAVVFDITESGSDVTVAGSGFLNITGLSGAVTAGLPRAIDPDKVLFAIGAGTAARRTAVSITGPATLGSGTTLVNATSQTGDFFGFDTALSRVFMPSGYVSGSSLNGTATWANHSFTSLGLTPGTYVYTVNATGNPNLDTFTVNIGVAAVPEPGCAALMLLGLCGVTLRRRRSR